MDTTSLKVCTQCKEPLPHSAFYVATKRPDGLQDECKECHSARHFAKLAKTPDREGEKTCRICGATKKRTEFYAAKSNRDGLRTDCKTCTNDENARWAAANPGKRKKIRNASAKRARAIPEKRDVIYAKTRQWQRDHPEAVQVHRATEATKVATTPTLKATRKKSHAKANRKWFDNHPTYKRMASSKRRALIKGCEVIDGDIDIDRLYARDKGICSLCHKKVNKALKHPDPGSPTIDHIIPLAKGGPHSWPNVTLAHLGCNSAKRERTAIQQMRLF